MTNINTEQQINQSVSQSNIEKRTSFHNTNPLINYILDNVQFKQVTLQNKAVSFPLIRDIQDFVIRSKVLNFEHVLFSDIKEEMNFLKQLFIYMGLKDINASNDLMYFIKIKQNEVLSPRDKIKNSWDTIEDIFKSFFKKQNIVFYNQYYAWELFYAWLVKGTVYYDIEIEEVGQTSLSQYETSSNKIIYLPHLFAIKENLILHSGIITILIDNTVSVPRFKILKENTNVLAVKGNEFFVYDLLHKNVYVYTQEKQMFTFANLLKTFIGEIIDNLSNNATQYFLTTNTIYTSSSVNTNIFVEKLKKALFDYITLLQYQYEETVLLNNNTFKFSQENITFASEFPLLFFKIDNDGYLYLIIRYMYSLFLEFFLIKLLTSSESVYTNVSSLLNFFTDEHHSLQLLISNYGILFNKNKSTLFDYLYEFPDKFMDYLSNRNNIFSLVLITTYLIQMAKTLEESTHNNLRDLFMYFLKYIYTTNIQTLHTLYLTNNTVKYVVDSLLKNTENYEEGVSILQQIIYTIYEYKHETDEEIKSKILTQFPETKTLSIYLIKFIKEIKHEFIISFMYLVDTFIKNKTSLSYSHLAQYRLIDKKYIKELIYQYVNFILSYLIISPETIKELKEVIEQSHQIAQNLLPNIDKKIYSYYKKHNSLFIHKQYYYPNLTSFIKIFKNFIQNLTTRLTAGMLVAPSIDKYQLYLESFIEEEFPLNILHNLYSDLKGININQIGILTIKDKELKEESETDETSA